MLLIRVDEYNIGLAHFWSPICGHFFLQDIFITIDVKKLADRSIPVVYFVLTTHNMRKLR